MNDKTISVLLGAALGIIITVGIAFVVNTCKDIDDEKTTIEQEAADNRIFLHRKEKRDEKPVR